MEDQTSWKNHSFTLLVFGGIVVLCSIFFVLGMLVGRTQGQKLAALAAAPAEKDLAKDLGKEDDPAADRPALTQYDSVEKNKEPVLEPEPAPPPAAAPAARMATPQKPPAKPAEDPAPPANVMNYQIAALSKSADAGKLADDLKKKGFHAFVLAPSGSDANRLYRVQVGPLANASQAETIRKKLESAGYKPILKR